MLVTSGGTQNISNKRNYELIGQFLLPNDKFSFLLTNKIHFILSKSYGLHWPTVCCLGAYLTELNFSSPPRLFSSSYLGESFVDPILILVNCPQVRWLNLSGCISISSISLKIIVVTYKTVLKKLVLKDVALNEDVLIAIAECGNLSYLDISRNKQNHLQLGFDCLKKAFTRSEGPTELSRNLQVLLMKHVYCEDSPRFIAMLLLYWCPRLLVFSHSEVWNGLARLCELNCGPKQLCLTRCISIYGFPFRANQYDISMLLRCVPKLQFLDIKYDTDSSTVLALKTLGSTLIDLTYISYTMPLDFLQYIALLCPNLQSLHLNQVCPLENDEAVMRRDFENACLNISRNSATPWSNLTDLCMTGDLNSWDYASSSVLKRIVENSYRSLESLTISVISGGLQVLTECFQCGKLNNLKYLHLKSAGITPNIIWAWLEPANSLKVVEIYDSQISEHDKNALISAGPERKQHLVVFTIVPKGTVPTKIVEKCIRKSAYKNIKNELKSFKRITLKAHSPDNIIQYYDSDEPDEDSDISFYMELCDGTIDEFTEISNLGIS
ncbi:unnamed protein product [Clavelina lepadiformis]|uniref:Uncharacterized protein n=1 Tax=Clavelina lepadiformis TaxID=159417 RepID=A0ABP0FHW8_CLALP